MSEKVNNDEPLKALLLQRFLAFVIDMFLILIVASLISTPFVDTERLEKIEKQEFETLEKFQNEEIDAKTYIDTYSSLYYKSKRESGLVSIITIFLEVAYFVVYQIYKKGQTIGKKLMKIKVVSDDGELSSNQMIYRSFIANFIIFSLLSFVFMLFGPKDIFFHVSIVFECIQFLILLISAIMIMKSENGKAIHDRLAHTTVIRV